MLFEKNYKGKPDIFLKRGMSADTLLANDGMVDLCTRLLSPKAFSWIPRNVLLSLGRFVWEVGRAEVRTDFVPTRAVEFYKSVASGNYSGGFLINEWFLVQNVYIFLIAEESKVLYILSKHSCFYSTP